jgi:hypothetical protein
MGPGYDMFRDTPDVIKNVTWGQANNTSKPPDQKVKNGRGTNLSVYQHWPGQALEPL